jgi:hypothetical protein
MSEVNPLDVLHPRPDFETTPERIKVQREAVRGCVNAIRKPGNIDQFLVSTEHMFRTFDMATDDPVLTERNHDYWRQNYKDWHESGHHTTDIEFRGQDKLYANVYFIGEILPRNKEFTVVSPGACSLPVDKDPDSNKRPTDQFYYEFEEAIGMDHFTLRHGQSHYLFVVLDNGKYLRINALSPKLAHFAINKIRNL